MLKQTPFNAMHRSAGAKLVDFGGWEMPVNYGSQIEEHHAVRRDAGMFDVSHMLSIDLSGPEVRRFLRYALANNVDKLSTPGKALYACLLNETGGVIDDLIVYFFREDWFRVVVNAGTADKDITWLEQLRERTGSKLDIKPRRDLAMLAVQGPQARARVWDALPGSQAASEALQAFSAAQFDEITIARTGYTGEDGFELIFAASRAEELWHKLSAVRPCGLGARDTLRLEAGMNLYGQDMDETVSPLEAGLAWTVDLKSPRDFMGKQALLAQPAKRQLTGLILLDKGGVLRAHQKVHSAQGEGEITSGSFSPTLNQSIAMARLPLAIDNGAQVQVEIRDKLLNAKVVKLPFVRHGNVLL